MPTESQLPPHLQPERIHRNMDRMADAMIAMVNHQVRLELDIRQQRAQLIGAYLALNVSAWIIGSMDTRVAVAWLIVAGLLIVLPNLLYIGKKKNDAATSQGSVGAPSVAGVRSGVHQERRDTP